MSLCGCKRESWIGVVVEERQLERGRDCEKGYSIIVLYLEDQNKNKKIYWRSSLKYHSYGYKALSILDKSVFIT